MKIIIKCDCCNCDFTRSKFIHERNVKVNKKEFCSRACAGTYNKQFKINTKTKKELRHFKVFYSSCQKRRDKKEVNITLEYLAMLWEQQKGICPITGWVLKINKTKSNKLPLTPDRASLDRIDSSKGYIIGNVRYIAYIAQVAKYKFTDHDLFEFTKSVTNHMKDKNYECNLHM